MARSVYERILEPTSFRDTFGRTDRRDIAPGETEWAEHPNRKRHYRCQLNGGFFPDNSHADNQRAASAGYLVKTPLIPECRQGWAVVAGTFTILLLSFGSAYSFGTFFAPLQVEYGASRGAVALAFSVAIVVLFAIGAGSGIIADRGGPRWLVAGGTVLVGIGLVAASQASALWQVQAAFGIGVGIGIGFSHRRADICIRPSSNGC